MAIRTLIDDLMTALSEAGCKTHQQVWAQFEAATDADIAALVAEIGCELTDDLDAWFRHVGCGLPLDGNYEAVSIKSVLSRIEGTREIDFSQHHKNIKGWNDGRFDSGALADTYWQPQWVPIARDGCGNEYCVDLAPGPNGVRGQLIAMEFQDGQGPYLAKWRTIEAMLQTHLKMLADGKYFVDEEGFLEYDT